MNWLFRLLGWDNPRMTRLGLTKLAGGICLAFVALASAWSQTRITTSIGERSWPMSSKARRPARDFSTVI